MTAFEPATSGDVESIRALLAEASLPLDGLEDQFPAAFVVARDEAGVTAVAGLEQHGSAGLLRSVAVRASHRGTGLGQALVANRLVEAQRLELRSVYALTTTEASFFEHIGFQRTPRTAAPRALQQSVEFASACPQSAACLVRALA